MLKRCFPVLGIPFEYCRRKAHICEKILGTASSVIHLSFDLWTAPNNSAYIDVIAQFLDAKKELRTVVLAVRNIHGDHSGKNQAKAIITVIDEYALKEKLGYFITDNASSNDICVAEIIYLIQPDLDLGERRLRCMGHIINLIAKAFIFGNKSETFEADIAIAENINDFEAAMKLWRKRVLLENCTILFDSFELHPKGKLWLWILQSLSLVNWMSQIIVNDILLLLMIIGPVGIQLTLLFNGHFAYDIGLKNSISPDSTRTKTFPAQTFLTTTTGMNLLFSKTSYPYSIDCLCECKETA